MQPNIKDPAADSHSDSSHSTNRRAHGMLHGKMAGQGERISGGKMGAGNSSEANVIEGGKIGLGGISIV